MPNCSSATSHGSRWVWSMTAVLAFTSTSDVSWCRCFQLFDHEPIIGRLAGRVRAVPILEHDAAEPLRLERFTPGTQAPRDIRGQPDIGTGGEDAFEMPPPLEERYLEERLAIDLEEVEGREDLAATELSRVRVSVLVDLEIALVLPAFDEDPIQDRGAALRLGDDRVVQLTRPVHLPLIANEVRFRMADPDEDSRPGPRWLEDVAVPLRPFADRPRPLGQEIRPEDAAQDSSIRALDSANVRSIMRTSVRNWLSRGAPWHRHRRFSCPSVKGSSPPHHHSTWRWHPRPGGCHLAFSFPSLRDHGRGLWPSRPARKRRPSRALAERGAASSALVDSTNDVLRSSGRPQSCSRGDYFFSPSPRAAMMPASGPARLVNSVGMMNFVAGDDPSWLSVLKY